MVFLAIGNGAIRQLGYGKFMSELIAHQLSCFTAIIVFFLYTFFLASRWPLEQSRQAWVVGTIWLILTIAFEFAFGHYMAKQPWDKLLNDYNILAGRLWSFVLVAVACMPYAVYKIRSRRG